MIGDKYEREISKYQMKLRLGSVLIIIAMFATSLSATRIQSRQVVADTDNVETIENVTDAEFLNPFDNLEIEAKAYQVFDVSNQKVISERNSQKQYPLASLTKIMTAIVASESVPEYTTVTIGNGSISKEGDSGLSQDEKWNLKKLLQFILIVSSNDGAHAVASVIESVYSGHPDAKGDRNSFFMSLMNKKARDIGLKDTYFLNETGLDLETQGGGYGSANDMSILLSYALKNHRDILEATKEHRVEISSLDGKLHRAKNTNDLVLKIPGVLASKTGYTDLSGGNLVVAYDAGINRPIIITVLGSSFEGRFKDMEKLINATIEYMPYYNSL